MIPADRIASDDLGDNGCESAADMLFESLLVAYDEALNNRRLIADTCSGVAPSDILSSSDGFTEMPAEVVARLAESTDCLRLLAAVRSSGILDDLCLPLSQRSPDEREDWEDELPSHIGRFKLVRELGRGGFGVVFLAVDPTLGRQVALKIPRPEVVVSRKLRERFLREAQAASLLDHPNLVSVYEVGEESPFCYIAAAFCAGPTLRDWLRNQPRQSTPQQAAGLVARLADGVEHAHRRGVLHRDIKPSNVMMVPLDLPSPSQAISDELPFEPKLTDFGLAKLMEQQDDHTRTGLILGTAAYMSPEQATGRTREVAATTDVYGLGMILYELLAGCTAFPGGNDLETLRHVTTSDATPPSRLRRGLPRDLEAICLKALEKRPADRYGTAAEFAEDLRRYLRKEPTVARPLSSLAKTWRWCRKRPVVASLLTACCVLVAAMIVGVVVYNDYLANALQAMKESERKTRLMLYAADMRAAQAAWTDARPHNAEALLARYLPQVGQEDIREFTWHYLWRLTSQSLITLRGHQGDVYAAIPSPDNRLISTCGKDHSVRLWNALDGQELIAFRDHAAEVNCICFSNDGKLLASAGDDGTVHIYDIAGRTKLHTQQTRHSAILSLAFSPDGSLLATGGKDCEICLWKTDSWEPFAVLKGHTDFVQCLEFALSGKTLASGGENVRLWDLATLSQSRSFDDFSSTVSSVKFSPDEKRLVAGIRDHTARMWQLDKDQPAAVFTGHTAAIHGVALTRFGHKLATASSDGRVIVWDLASRQKLREFRGHGGRVWSVAFSRDHEAIITAGDDGTAKICKLAETYEEPHSGAGDTSPDLSWYSVAFSPQGNLFAATGEATNLTVTVLDWPPAYQSCNVFYSGGRDVGFLRSGKTVAWWDGSGKLSWFDNDSSQRGEQILADYAGAAGAFEPDGSCLVFATRFPLPIWDLQRKQLRGDLPGQPAVQAYKVVFDRTGRRLAIAQSDNCLTVWDFARKQQIARLATLVSPTTALAFTPNADLLSAGDDGMVRRWSINHETEIASFDAQSGRARVLAVHPGGRTVAVGGETGVKLFDLETHSPLVTLTNNRSARCTTFSPDGTHLVGGFDSAKLFVWRTAPADLGDRVVSAATSERAAWSHNAAPIKAVDEIDGPLPLEIPEGLHDVANRFRAVADWCGPNGFKSAFPTFIDGHSDLEITIGAVGLLRTRPLNRIAYEDELRLLPADSTLPGDLTAALQNQVFRWSVLHGRRAAIPNYHQSIHDNRLNFGCTYLGDDDVEVVSVPTAELGDVETHRSRLRAIQPYAQRLGFAGGFPNFVDEEVDGQPAIGVVLIKKSAATPLTIPVEDLRE